MSEPSQVIFDSRTVEFVTVAAEYCAFMERCESANCTSFVDTLRKLLPLLYLKASLLPECFPIDEFDSPETFATEEQYNTLRMAIADIMGCYDDYLDVFLSDMKYSDTPIRCTVSESLADIWQDLFNFVCRFRTGVNATMNDALVECRESFAAGWGQTLVNTLRALHEISYIALASDADGANEYPDKAFL